MWARLAPRPAPVPTLPSARRLGGCAGYIFHCLPCDRGFVREGCKQAAASQKPHARPLLLDGSADLGGASLRAWTLRASGTNRLRSIAIADVMNRHTPPPPNPHRRDDPPGPPGTRTTSPPARLCGWPARAPTGPPSTGRARWGGRGGAEGVVVARRMECSRQPREGVEAVIRISTWHSCIFTFVSLTHARTLCLTVSVEAIH
jgi:hypothetical protein